MATNLYSPFGFRSSALYGASGPNYAMQTNQIAYNNTHVINYGDPVVLTAAGTIDLYTAGGPSLHGIFRGCEYTDPDGGPILFHRAWRAPTLAATTVVSARVEVDRNMVYLAQVQGGPVTQANVGQNIDIVAGSSGVVGLTGQSVCGLAFSTAATTATLPFRIIGILQGVGLATVTRYNSANANNIVEVLMNTSDIRNQTGI